MLIHFLVRSPWGRVLKAIREDEDAVRSLGKNVYSFKMQSLVVGGVIGAFAGVLFALGRQSVAPDSLGTALTFSFYVILVLGGAARVLGPVLGTVVFFFLYGFVDVALRQAIGADHINFLVANEVGIVRQTLVGVGLMAPHDLPTTGHHRRQAGGGGQCPPLRPPASPMAHVFAGLAPEPGVAKPDPILVADEVSRRFGGLTAVDVEHVEVQRGAITALIGPNGAGKTTFFNLLTGFDQPEHAVAGPSTARTSAARPAHKVARKGMVRTFQLTKSLARLSVLDNMKLGATGQRGEGFFAALVRPLWSSAGGRRRGPGGGAARAVQARPHARRVRRLAVGRPAQAARDGAGADGRARPW